MKKIKLTLPDTLLEQVDEYADKEKISRSALIRECLEIFVNQRQKQDIQRQLEQGYQIMAEINSEWAEFCLEADNQVQSDYEEILSESE